MNIVNPKEAKASGYRALTNNYHLPREQGMLDNVLADMRRGNISHCVVMANGGVAVWRRARKGGEL